MPPNAAHTSRWRIAEIVFGVPFLAALLLQWRVPASLPRGAFGPAFIVGGAALIALGVAIVVLARREFARRGQPTDPGQPTSAIITTGIFAVSRNPLYIGAICLLAGVALAANLPWALALLLPSIAACRLILIAPEERYLRATFGDEYRRYAATVCRWLGRAASRKS